MQVNNTRRLFFALYPTPAVRVQAERLRDELDLDGRRVPATQFHITLVFVGAVPEGGTPRLESSAAATVLPALKLRLDRAGCFPRARVAWLGSSLVPAELIDFREQLAAALRSAGVGFDPRPWSPHLTLYRDLRTPFATIPVRPLDWPVESFCLVESSSLEGEVRYRVLELWRAGAAGNSREPA